MAGEAVTNGLTGTWVLAQAEGVPVVTPGPEAVELHEAIAEELHAGVGVEEHATEEGTFPPFDPTFFASQLLWLAITFTVLYLLMSKVILPRIGGILEDRRDRIARDLDQAGRLKQQSDEAIASYERALADARTRAMKIAAESRDKAKAEAASRQADTEANLDRQLSSAEARIAEIKQKALADVGEIAGQAAEAVVERLLGTRPSATELTAAVSDATAKGNADA